MKCGIGLVAGPYTSNVETGVRFSQSAPISRYKMSKRIETIFDRLEREFRDKKSNPRCHWEEYRGLRLLTDNSKSANAHWGLWATKYPHCG